MPLDLELFGSKVRKYREQLVVSLDDISTATGINKAILMQLEKGEKEPSGDEVLILADYFKCDYNFFISNEKLAPFEQTEELFRIHGAEITKEDRWKIQEFLFLCECEHFLLSELGRAVTADFIYVKKDNFHKRQGENAAVELRSYFGYRDTTIERNVYNDFRKLGIHVFRRKLANSNISGLFIKHPVAGKCILVNYLEDPYRQRFTVSHEVAHAILDDENEFVLSIGSKDVPNYSEIRANTFASRYLIPPGLLRSIPNNDIWNEDRIIDYANRIWVSASAFVIALKEAKLIDASTANKFKSLKVPINIKEDPELPAELSPNSRQRREEMLQRGLSTFYVNLCFEAYDRDIVSLGRMSEMLLSEEKDLMNISETFGRQLLYGD